MNQEQIMLKNVLEFENHPLFSSGDMSSQHQLHSVENEEEDLERLLMEEKGRTQTHRYERGEELSEYHQMQQDELGSEGNNNFQG